MPSISGALSDIELMVELGRRLKALRLARDLGVADVAARAGVNRNTVLAAEAGRNPRLGTLVAILRALGRLDALDGFLPAPPVSPLALIRGGRRPRRRASRRG
ncbi:MAG TPA: helix-turn-helix transcriptional regulator [Gemmatimonadales bacterium]|jgi:transcriptional regulator with XRE-family HTH domain